MSEKRFTAADRIRELSAISADVASMIQSAGKALAALSDKPLQRVETANTKTNDDDIDMTTGSPRLEKSEAASLGARKESFQANTKAYYETLQSVIARLRRQTYALEEAGIIASKVPTLSTKGTNVTVDGAQIEINITDGGLGTLDVGWLNGRGNKVGAEKERELVCEAKSLAQKVLDEAELQPRDDEDENPASY